MKPLTDLELDRQKRSFISARKGRLSIVGLTLVFALVAIATWVSSALLLWWGMKSMPLRYGLSIVIGYAVFFGLVRVWADYQRQDPNTPRSDGWLTDIPVTDSEGCLFAIGFFAVGLVLSVLFAWLAGVVLLEVAFEVIFAGVLVHRMGQLQRVGNWKSVLFRHTWWLVAFVVILSGGFAYHYQKKYPAAVKLSDVWNMSRSR